eukprot:Opistho-1_new@11515
MMAQEEAPVVASGSLATAPSSNGPSSTTSTAPAARPKEPLPVADFSECRVCVVEDNNIMQRVIARWLSTLKIKTFAQCFDGLQALETCLKEPFDVIFMDIHVPNLKGSDVCLRLRESQCPNTTTPVVAMTGQAIDPAFMKKYRMSDVLLKPVTLASFAGMIEKLRSTSFVEPSGDAPLSTSPNTAPVADVPSVAVPTPTNPRVLPLQSPRVVLSAGSAEELAVDVMEDLNTLFDSLGHLLNQKNSAIIITREKLTSKVVSQHMKRMGVAVTEVNDGLAGFDRVAKSKFDLVIVDTDEKVSELVQRLRLPDSPNRESSVVAFRLPSYGAGGWSAAAQAPAATAPATNNGSPNGAVPAVPVSPQPIPSNPKAIRSVASTSNIGQFASMASSGFNPGRRKSMSTTPAVVVPSSDVVHNIQPMPSDESHPEHAAANANNGGGSTSSASLGSASAIGTLHQWKRGGSGREKRPRTVPVPEEPEMAGSPRGRRMTLPSQSSAPTGVFDTSDTLVSRPGWNSDETMNKPEWQHARKALSVTGVPVRDGRRSPTGSVSSSSTTASELSDSFPHSAMPDDDDLTRRTSDDGHTLRDEAHGGTGGAGVAGSSSLLRRSGSSLSGGRYGIPSAARASDPPQRERALSSTSSGGSATSPWASVTNLTANPMRDTSASPGHMSPSYAKPKSYDYFGEFSHDHVQQAATSPNSTDAHFDAGGRFFSEEKAAPQPNPLPNPNPSMYSVGSVGVSLRRPRRRSDPPEYIVRLKHVVESSGVMAVPAPVPGDPEAEEARVVDGAIAYIRRLESEIAALKGQVP